MKIRYFITLAACLFCMTTLAQKKNPSNEAEFRTKQQAYMTKKAALTPEESEKFFPLYFEFQDKKKAINKEAWKIARKGKNPETTDTEYQEIIDTFFDNQETIAKLEKEYIKKYRAFLSDKKVYMVYWAERKFTRNMLKILQEMEDKE
ncbi:MAG: hypothetical protein IKW43_05220 [Bacteroidaceae bacterium]|nr:hypothetical protein [Bacteroidaceae bacterium]